MQTRRMPTDRIALSGSWRVRPCSGLRELDCCRALLAGDHRGAHEKLSRSSGIGGDLTQLVQILSSHVGITRFQPLLVGDRLLLHELYRNRAPLPIVNIEQTLGRIVEKNSGELVRDVDGVLNAAVQAHAAN